MTTFNCATCGKFMTHGDWKKFGKHQLVRVHTIFDGENETEETIYSKFCSRACFVYDLVQQHLIIYNMEMEDVAKHLKEEHGVNIDQDIAGMRKEGLL